ncbi:uncharacterized protein LOC106179405 [Lingula anatina]|uniref:Uncharacterized protein LOC106179405 n=1 Tax=Lingula anatina TaxID=7574 RepID=A0A1S3K7Q8_LINAN|nr:uncharacterized protein LOC106179405 [Lingula anatina]|eukprot:XP_013418479.1 uncharacterized protein LOC106179405 [Lingula anatina]
MTVALTILLSLGLRTISVYGQDCRLIKHAGVVLNGDSYDLYMNGNERKCRMECEKDARCRAMTYHAIWTACWLKSDVKDIGHSHMGSFVSYQRPKDCKGPGKVIYGTNVLHSKALANKLQEIANYMGADVRVHSGLREGNDKYHAIGQAADITISGVDSRTAWERLKSSDIFTGDYYVMYHAPGRRSCSTGTHLHIARYEKEGSTGRPTCWVLEGTTHANTCLMYKYMKCL